MTREVKFRAFTGSKKLRKVDEIMFHADGSYSVGFGRNTIDWYSDKTEPRLRLMQYTGLKDKNGREIYEGDWIDTGLTSGSPNTALRNREKIAGQVFFADGGFYFGNPKSKHDRWLITYGLLKVIGNIYENPELLK